MHPMRRILIFLMVALMSLTACSKVEKPKTAEAREAMRTRTTEIPIDSAFTPKAVGTAFDVFGDINAKALVGDLKGMEIDTSSDESATKQWLGNFKQLTENHSEGYQPGLTLYFVIVLILFVIILIAKGIRTFIIKK